MASRWTSVSPDNAVRTHMTVLGRDGIVAEVGSQRDTGGKPAKIYALTTEREELFPKAYALVLGKLVAEIARKDGLGATLKWRAAQFAE